MEMSPLAGWQPNWVTKVVVLIVIIGVALPVLLLSVLASRDQIAQQRAMLNVRGWPQLLLCCPSCMQARTACSCCYDHC